MSGTQEQCPEAARGARRRLHPVTVGVLIAWAVGVLQFAYFGLLLSVRVTGGP